MTKHSDYYKSIIVLFAALIVALFLLSPPGYTQGVQKIKSDEDSIREEMTKITREIGVTCTECHNVKNFKDDAKPNFRVGLEHIKITQMLKDNGFNGKNGPEASCFMCHKGELKPKYKYDHKKD